ncbi:hypothetical protein [Methylotenera versatilis]|jgi:hypothetical protein|uniref:Phosphate-selective porin O and P n=1 Tax=Methylotenera versatilis (strain 301) TaxID=666681 RepID=D7DHR0_METV0|nr:hypothetical protein [Methylotenera versatilis]ADI29595.1 conserved hypothetical protein [Methylotenera versatilis 301]
MFNQKVLVRAIALTFLLPAAAKANDSNELEALRAEIQQMKQSYESRIQTLESRLQTTETVAGEAGKKAEEASVQASARPTSSNALNPDISLILSGTYANRSQDSNYHITGFQAGGEIGPGTKGFNLGESELGVYASVDPNFYGGLNLALAPDNTIGVEEAFVQTTTLPYGVTLKAGRFFSSIGYLNDQHAHTWDFVDNPLAYQAFLGNQFGDDGIQLKWLAPTDMFLELGAEYGRGRIADTEGRDKNGGGAGSLFAHVGGDLGVSSSWRAGLSYLEVSPKDRLSNDIDAVGNDVTNSFTGNSKVWLADFVWKWAPNGNATNTSFKLQGEYLHRKENGDLTNGTGINNYTASQDGWYLQGVYKFLPYWRAGLRYDQLNSGSVNYGDNAANLANSSYDPKRISAMLDFSPSEFSRIRLQVSSDKSRQEATDNQIFIQYQMSLGAHGAHKY